MEYQVISADCHIDLIWLPPELFTANASKDLKDRMPYVTDGEKGPVWVSRGGAQFGLQNGMGSAGREYVPGQIHRSDRMAETGLYDDGKKGIRRLTDPALRIKDRIATAFRPKFCTEFWALPNGSATRTRRPK